MPDYLNATFRVTADNHGRLQLGIRNAEGAPGAALTAALQIQEDQEDEALAAGRPELSRANEAVAKNSAQAAVVAGGWQIEEFHSHPEHARRARFPQQKMRISGEHSETKLV